MKMLWKSLVESGMKKEASPNYNRQIYLTNHFIIIVSVLLLGSAVFDVWQGFFLQSLATLIVILLFTIAYVAIGLGYFKAARAFLLICLNFAIFFFDNYFGYQAGVFMYYSALLVGSAFGLAISNTIRRYLTFIILPVALFAITVITDYQLIGNKPEFENIQLYFYGNVFCNLGINIALVHIMTKNNSLYTRQISRQNRKLMTLNASMDKFVHGVTHDLRAPLSSVLGLINLSKTEGDVERLREYNRLKEKSLLKMEEFIRDMLDFVKNEQSGLIRKPIQFNTLLEEVFDQLKFDSDTEKVSYSVEINQDVEFYGDAKRLSIILSNLIANSIRYADLKKESPFVKILVNVGEEAASVKVTDNGIGIPEDIQDRVFDMFFRADSTRSGSGLGLYIVKETLTKMNGEIKVDSRQGEGTTFHLILKNEFLVDSEEQDD